MWTYSNPVKTLFGTGIFNQVPQLIAGRRYALVTYPDAPFQALTRILAELAGPATLVIDDIAPNPDYRLLQEQCARFGDLDVIVALGGGSVIDSAKVFAAATGDFGKVARFLETKTGADELASTPIIAIPTTAGTGSEVTCWATVWQEETGKKFSLARANLYPETAVIDPSLMVNKPYGLTLATGLDTLSHALESIWNINANPISARHAVGAARQVIDTLPALLSDMGNLQLRTRMAEASLSAGLAFSNTKTAIAHNLSYPITLGWGVQHGIACSFTLPVILRSVDGLGGFRQDALHEIFGPDLAAGADTLNAFLSGLGVATRFADYGISEEQRMKIINDAFAGERGRNFAGTKDAFLAAEKAMQSSRPKVA
jgi:alcohol dehydrogenase